MSGFWGQLGLRELELGVGVRATGAGGGLAPHPPVFALTFGALNNEAYGQLRAVVAATPVSRLINEGVWGRLGLWG